VEVLGVLSILDTTPRRSEVRKPAGSQSSQPVVYQCLSVGSDGMIHAQSSGLEVVDARLRLYVDCLAEVLVWMVAQVPVIQLLLGSTGIVSSNQMLSVWRYVVVGAVVAAAVLTPSTDPFTQTLLAVPLILLYIGGAVAVRAVENSRSSESPA